MTNVFPWLKNLKFLVRIGFSIQDRLGAANVQRDELVSGATTRQGHIENI